MVEGREFEILVGRLMEAHKAAQVERAEIQNKLPALLRSKNPGNDPYAFFAFDPGMMQSDKVGQEVRIDVADAIDPSNAGIRQYLVGEDPEWSTYLERFTSIRWSRYPMNEQKIDFPYSVAEVKVYLDTKDRRILKVVAGDRDRREYRHLKEEQRANLQVYGEHLVRGLETLGYRDAQQSTQRAYEKWVVAQTGQGLSRLLQSALEKVGIKQPPLISWESFMMDGLYKQRDLH